MPKKKNKSYESLDALIGEDVRSDRYFSALPDYVQSQIRQRSDSVNSYESLKDYAENLLRGDD